MTYSEWDQDLDKMSAAWPRDGQSTSDIPTKGRCMQCWGSLTARGNSERVWTAIQCRVCGSGAKGRAAREEMERMQSEMATNLLLMDSGAVSSYHAGQFAFKIFPDIPRLSGAEVRSRVAAHKQHDRRKWITRADFPAGSAGWLIFQARALLAGIDHPAMWDERSVAGFTEFDTRDDGSLFVPDGSDSHADAGDSKETRVLRWMGSTMTAVLNSAFACELTLKAIALTCKDVAKKEHDLAALLSDLPDASRHRIQADYEDVAILFEQKRHAFGAWRYFERNAGEGGPKALVDIAAARDLGRAARVLLDEAEVVGLRSGFAFNATRETEEVERAKLRRDHFQIRLTGSESPTA